MKRLIGLTLLGCMIAAPAMAAPHTIRGYTILDSDVGGVYRQCNALRSKANRSPMDNVGPGPAAGESVDDPANYWATDADRIDSAFSHIDLSALTLRDCKEAGL